MRLFVLLCLSLILGVHTHALLATSIAIVTYKNERSKPWDPESINSGVTGSEESVIYMSQELAKLGYRVVVLGNPPKGSKHSNLDANPRFVDLELAEKREYDIAISWRMPDIALNLKQSAKRVYFWPHDTYHWKLAPTQIDGFDDVFWSSEWQREQWISVNPAFAKFTKIFGNGIDQSQFAALYATSKRTNPYSCIYSSNYARGLEILLDIWPEVHRKYPRATLDIYYGWNHWGLLDPKKEVWMRSQVEVLELIGVHEHGLVSHEELNRAYSQSSFWTYPCIAPETFCINAIRAQALGTVPVIIEDTALKETVRYGYRCKGSHEYLKTLLKAMSDAEKITQDERKKMGQFVFEEYTWQHIAYKWHELFTESDERVMH